MQNVPGGRGGRRRRVNPVVLPQGVVVYPSAPAGPAVPAAAAVPVVAPISFQQPHLNQEDRDLVEQGDENETNTQYNNYYAFPPQAMRWLEQTPGLINRRSHMIDLINLRRTINRLVNDGVPHQLFFPRVVVDPYTLQRMDNSIEFMKNAVRQAGRVQADLDDYIFARIVQPPPLVPVRIPSFIVPLGDVFDLPTFLVLYILFCFSALTYATVGSRSASYHVGVRTDQGATQFLGTRQNSHVQATNRHLSVEVLIDIYMDLMKIICDNLGQQADGRQSAASWNGSEDSGTRVMLRDGGNDIELLLEFVPVRRQNNGGMWTPELQQFLDVTGVNDCVLTVRNPNDNKCLLYAIIIGLFVKVLQKRNLFETENKVASYSKFPPHSHVIDDYEIFCKATVYTNSLPPGEQNGAVEAIKFIAKFLVPVRIGDLPVFMNDEEERRIHAMVQDLDRKVGMMLSVEEFRSQMKQLEDMLIPNKVCGLDIYGIDFNINKHVYPLYISKNREKTIQLLCITPPGSDTSHYCYILDMEALMKNTGGKQFFSCSKCSATFYTRRLLLEHQEKDCNVGGSEDDDMGWHWSEKLDKDFWIPDPGFCYKCRLMFHDKFLADYHKDHCFMEGKTGYRHVRLLDPEDSEKDSDGRLVLHGETVDEAAEAKHVARSRVMYADFECSINPETGVHTFMSYGIYDWKSKNYECGYSLDKFWDYVLERAYGGSEEHIYVYFHNAMNYDANFILRHVLRKIKNAIDGVGDAQYRHWTIKTIMKSTNRLQKLVFYTKIDGKSRAIHIGDTFLFLTLSLERIVGSIRKDDLEINKENFTRFFEIFKERYPGVSEEEIDHILRKNIFPYRFFTDSGKLDTGKDEFLKIFEPREDNRQFFSERVTVEDLQKAYPDTRHVMEVFGCRTAKDYHDLYLCCDVMQLADVFDRSMNILWESHHIHLTKYLGMPAASWAAFLRYDATMEIPLYTSTFYAEFFKGMIRGGITSAALRYAKADETHSIIYLDVNGLYPYVMQAYGFPCGEFRFRMYNVTESSVCHRMLYELFEVFEQNHTGGCFCVDMHIPDSVKMETDDYPFAPEHRRIFEEYHKPGSQEMTPFLQKWSKANEGEEMAEFTGLVCTLYDKEKYNVHWRLLKFYIDHGVEITKIHFGVFFEEGDYLAGYVRRNIEIRNGRKDELGKTVYKLLGNSVYGKTFESPFKRNTYEIVVSESRLQGLIDESAISSMTPIDDLGWIVKYDGEEIVLDKPTYIGACVCEFSKLHMYTLLYDKMKKIFPQGCRLVYTDTDSFILQLTHAPELSETRKLFEYIKACDPTLIGPIGGQVKSETGEDTTIAEVIALRSKVYSYKTKDGHIGKRAKGTTYDAQEMQLDWETYKQTLESLTSCNTHNVQFLRRTFRVQTVDALRRSLSVNDGKRFICKNGIDTHAFGFPIPNEEFQDDSSDSEEITEEQIEAQLSMLE